MGCGRGKKWGTLVLGFLFSWGLGGIAGADTAIPAGTISGTWAAADSPFVVQGNIELASGTALVVEPGVTVKFDAAAAFTVRGTLTAEGTTAQPIVFTSSAATPAPGDWVGIKFYSGSSDSLLSDCVVTYATQAVYVYALASGCTGQSVRPTLRRCELAYSSGYGVYARGQGSTTTGCSPIQKSGVASPRVEECDIHHNGLSGIYAYPTNGYLTHGANSSTIVGNHIHDNGAHGIYIQGSGYASPTISDNLIADNGGSGIYCTSSLGRASVTYNEIARNDGNGIYNRHEFMTIEGNWIHENGSCGLDTGELDRLYANDIADNGTCGLNYVGSAELSAGDHYWGGLPPATQITGGSVDFEPYRTTRDTAPPEVAAVYPADGAMDIAPGAWVRIVFSEEVDPATVAEESVTVSAGGTGISGTVSYGRKNAWFAPDAPFAWNTEYTVTITTAIRDIHFDRLAMAAPHVSTFATGGDCGDYCSGRIADSLSGPEDGCKGLTFDGQDLWVGKPGRLIRVIGGGVSGDEIDLGAVSPEGIAHDAAAFWCDDPGTGTIHRVDASGNVLTSFSAPGSDTGGLAFDGSRLLDASPSDETIYRMDTAGNVIEEIPVPGAPADLAAEGNRIWCAVGKTVIALDASGNPVDSFSFSETVYGLAFDGRFLRVHAGSAPGSIHRVSVDPSSDAEPPAADFVAPAEDAAGVDAGTPITVVFSESIDARTLNGLTFTLHDGVSSVSGTVLLNDRTAWFLPVGMLTYGGTYTATLSGAVRDQAGNPLPADFSWSFTVGPDCGAACAGRVLSVIPAHHVNPPRDIAYGADSIWVAVQDPVDFRRVSTAGALLGSLDTEISNTYIEAVAHDGVDFWIADDLAKRLFRVDSAGAIQDTISLPEAIVWPKGVDADSDRVWINGSGFAYRMDHAANFDRALPAPADRRIAFDGTTLYFADTATGKIHRMDAAGNLLSSLPAPAGHIDGLTFDGEHLWGLDTSEKQIYEIAPTEGEPLLAVSPETGLSTSGTVGGPFAPTGRTYTLTNAGEADLNWTVATDAGWLTVSPGSGTLAPGLQASVAVSLNAAAATLAANEYSKTVAFRNTGNGAGDTSRSVALAVSPLPAPVFTGEDVSGDSSPSWTWNSAGGTGTFQYKLDDDDFSSGATQTNQAVFTPSGALSDGLHTLYVRERDAAGNWSEPGAFVVDIDTGPPCSSVTVAPAGSCQPDGVIAIVYAAGDAYAGESCPSASGGSGVSRVALYVQRPGETGFSPSGLADEGAAVDGVFDYPLSGEGAYRFYTVAEDAAGNPEAAPGSPDAETVVAATRTGDLDGDTDVDLADAVAGLRVLAGEEAPDLIRNDYAVCDPDADGNGRVGLAEVVFILRKVSGF